MKKYHCKHCRELKTFHSAVSLIAHGDQCPLRGKALISNKCCYKLWLYGTSFNLNFQYADELFGSEMVEHFNSGIGSEKETKVAETESDKKEKRHVINYQHGDGEPISEYEDFGSCSSDEEEVEDIEKAIAKEVKQIKSLKNSRRFQEIPTGVNAILFIRTTLPSQDVNKLIHCILSDIAKTNQNKAR